MSAIFATGRVVEAPQDVPPVARILLDMKAIDNATLTAGLEMSKRTGRPLEVALNAMGRITKAQLIEAQCKAGIKPAVVRLGDLPEWDRLLTDKDGELEFSARDGSVALLTKAADDMRRSFMVYAAGSNQQRTHAVLAAAARHGYRVVGRIEVEPEFLNVLHATWDARHGSKSELVNRSEIQQEFDQLAYTAFKLNASDIHITGTRGQGQVHFRVHGELEHHSDMTEEAANALCATVYNTLAEAGSTKEGFNPSKTQDAVIERTFKEGLVRFRYSGVPIAPSGFDVTLRIIPIGVTTRRKEMHELGYSPDQCDELDRIFSYASGMILFAGTTGSGKSTSMANMLEKVAVERPGKKIRTVEEPVEYRIPGTYQTPVTRVNGDSSDFTVVLRQLMRADPDIIMVGEVRDHDTAELAISAVRSGHLCVSTLHADGAPICYDRLVGLGINRQDMASVGLVAGLIYQKLVAVLCPNCKIPADRHQANSPGDPIFRRLAKVVDSLDGIYFRCEVGCPRCDSRGVIGRTVCAEILRPTPNMLKAVSTGDSRELWRLWRATIKQGEPDCMTGRTAFEHAISKMRAGIVSPNAVESEFRYLDERPFEGIE